jgi:hypothetical protein
LRAVRADEAHAVNDTWAVTVTVTAMAMKVDAANPQ